MTGRQSRRNGIGVPRAVRRERIRLQRALWNIWVWQVQRILKLQVKHDHRRHTELEFGRWRLHVAWYVKGTTSGQEHHYRIWRFARWDHHVILWRAG